MCTRSYRGVELGAPASPYSYAQADAATALPGGDESVRGKRQTFQPDRIDLNSHHAVEEGSTDRLRFLHNAVFALWSRMPEYSARTVATPPQQVALLIGSILLAGALCFWPHTSAQVLVAFMSTGFLVSLVFRSALAWIGRRRAQTAAVTPALNAAMPVYTILVPLYREAAMLPQLSKALSTLDYPRSRLDIKFIVETDDAETADAVEAIVHDLPAEIVSVPPRLPRTKPKACNYALQFARGEFVVVFDAEDRPEPDQILKAVEAFRRSSHISCFQARLTVDNDRQSWLARMFALDYDLWFKMLLPGLAKLRVPIPLGGTSNHFRTSVLRAAGAWDPFNVTEDADLGIRLARLGYSVSMLDSTTFEEAPARFIPWLRQRTRWMKGYMQTLLVHTRHPARLERGVGVRGLAAIQLFLGGAVWSALVNPVLWVIFAVSLIGTQTGAHTQIMESLARISGISLLMCNVVLAVLSRTGTRRVWASAPFALGYLLYWLLVSVAAYRALWQLFFDPFRWEKTPHGEALDG
jgi:glycosyltransferase XagB